MGHHNTKSGYKRLHTNTQPSGNKYVSRALHPSPLKTPQCFPFSGKIIHHTAQKEVKRCCRVSSDVDWYVRVGRKSIVKAEIIILCARTLHHCKTPNCFASTETMKLARTESPGRPPRPQLLNSDSRLT